MALTYHNGVSIAEVVVYVPCLAVAIFLSIRHGFGRNAGWMFLIIFCLARIIGPCMQLATIGQPHNTSLYTGSAILQNIGLSPLMLATLGLLSRALESIKRSHHTFVDTRMLKLVEIIITVGLILGIVGGVNASDDFAKTGIYQPSTLNKASTALFITAYVAVVILTILMLFSISHAEPGEKRLTVAVAVSLPLFLIRLIYSVLSNFTHIKAFSVLSGNITLLICLVLIEELIIIIMYEGVGLTLKRQSEAQHVEGQTYMETAEDGVDGFERGHGGAGNIALRIAKKTIIGRLVTSVVPGGNARDVKMERPRHMQK